jgi:hypothetical protein
MTTVTLRTTREAKKVVEEFAARTGLTLTEASHRLIAQGAENVEKGNLDQRNTFALLFIIVSYLMEMSKSPITFLERVKLVQKKVDILYKEGNFE